MTKEPAAAPAAEVAAAPAAAAPAAKAAKGKKKTGLIIGIIIAVLALAGGIVALVLILNNKKDPVSAVTDATKNTYRALDGVNIGLKKETTDVAGVDGMDLTIDGTISAKGSASGFTIDGDLDFTAKIAQNKDVEFMLDVDALINSKSLKGSLDAIVTNDAVYAKVGNIKNLMNFFADMQGADSSYLDSEYSDQMVAMFDNQWLKVTNTTSSQSESQLPMDFNYSLSGKQDMISELQEYVDIEAYNGNEVQRKIGDLYKLTPKDKDNASGDPFYVEIKDDKIVRLYTKSNDATFGESAFDGEVSFDIIFNYDKVTINIPENALDFNGGQVEPTDIDPTSLDDLDDDELEEFKELCGLLKESDLNTCYEKFMSDDYDWDDINWDDYDYDDFDWDDDDDDYDARLEELLEQLNSL